MVRYLKLLLAFMKASLVREIGFKANFLVNVMVEIGWTLVTVFTLEIIFHNTADIAGWVKGEVFFIYALYRASSALYAIFFAANLRNFSHTVNSGDLDMNLIKPVNPLFLVSTRIVKVDRIAQLILGIMLMYYASLLVPFSWSFLMLALTLISMMSGSIIRLAMMIMVNCLVFWSPRLHNIERLELALFGLARFPRQAFPPALSQFMTWIVPVMFVSAVPAEVILGKINTTNILVIAGLATLLLLVATSLFNNSLKFYSSASS